MKNIVIILFNNIIENKKHVLRDENVKIKAELERYGSKVDELFKLVNLSEQANAVYNFKIEELTRSLDIEKESNKRVHELEKLLEEAKKRIAELELLLGNKDEEIVTKERSKTQYEKELTDKTQSAMDRLKVENEIKIKELKSEISVLQSTINKLNSDKGSLELELLNNSRKVTLANSSTGKITQPVNIDQKSKIFGNLRKVDGGTNKFIKEAQKESKKTEEILNIVWKDKIDDLKKLRENIIRMSPKTISTRSIPDEDYQNFDFDDEEAFKKMQAKLAEREKKHNEEKERLEKIRIDMEHKNK